VTKQAVLLLSWLSNEKEYSVVVMNADACVAHAAAAADDDGDDGDDDDGDDDDEVWIGGKKTPFLHQHPNKLV